MGTRESQRVRGSGWAAMLELPLPREGPAIERTAGVDSPTPAHKSPLWLSLYETICPHFCHLEQGTPSVWLEHLF